jgi:hypothetical protein
MAEIVAALGFPHTPGFPAVVKRDGPDCEIARFYGAVRTALEAARVDVMVMFDTDHLNTFFFDNLPIFAVGVDDVFAGPNDDVEAMPSRPMTSHRALAEHIRAACIEADFDVSSVEHYEVDHSVMVPLHFVTPRCDMPIIPVFICGHVPPWPSARRCLALGQTVRNAIRQFPGKLRVAVAGSGSFSLDVYGTRLNPGLPFGVPDPDWAMRVAELIAAADVAALVAEATPERIRNAGSVAGEILNWIALLGCTGTKRPLFVHSQKQFGHSYAAWQME